MRLRYRAGARWYDTLSLEALLYRPGRLAAVAAAGLRPGDRVLDVGCGTGLSLPVVEAAIGPSGRILGLEPSGAMTRRARARVAVNGWSNVELTRDPARRLTDVAGLGRFDAVLFCYSLAIVPDWQAAWRQALDALRPGGRVVVIDSDYLTGGRRILNPLVWIMLRVGGVHPARRVWRQVARDCHDVRHGCSRAGHVRWAVGTR